MRHSVLNLNWAPVWLFFDVQLDDPTPPAHPFRTYFEAMGGWKDWVRLRLRTSAFKVVVVWINWINEWRYYGLRPELRFFSIITFFKIYKHFRRGRLISCSVQRKNQQQLFVDQWPFPAPRPCLSTPMNLCRAEVFLIGGRLMMRGGIFAYESRRLQATPGIRTKYGSVFLPSTFPRIWWIFLHV